MPRKVNITMQQNNGCKFLLLFLRLAVVLISCFSNILAERLPIKTYTVADGLLRDNVHKIKQDSRGFMWFCTVEGVSRFDGYAFTNFTTDDGLPDRHVNYFLETKRGEIFVATDGGLARLNPTGIHGSKENPLFVVYPLDNPRAKQINVLFEDESGAIFIGTRDGLYKLNESGELESIYLGKSLNSVSEIDVVAIIKDRRGAMWIGTNSGLFRLPLGGHARAIYNCERIVGCQRRFIARRQGRAHLGRNAFHQHCRRFNSAGCRAAKKSKYRRTGFHAERRFASQLDSGFVSIERRQILGVDNQRFMRVARRKR